METIPTRLTRAQARNKALANKVAGAKDEDDVGLASWYHEAVLIAEQGKKEDKTRTNVDDGGECEDERKGSAVQCRVWCGAGWDGLVLIVGTIPSGLPITHRYYQPSAAWQWVPGRSSTRHLDKKHR